MKIPVREIMKQSMQKGNQYFLIGKFIDRQAQAPTPKIQDKTGSSAYASCTGSYQN
ncbi:MULTISPECIES: hypothetical protein [Comamonas]|uniref:hypothetical protein n=1 Tax=Comamonas TaxID=283 RepID=UPI0013F480E1|nr:MULTISPECIES: hypothetical protein [Comamonas]UNV98453.1 hypothetical protein MP579_14260 [Comamonas sp. 7D-2evo2]